MMSTVTDPITAALSDARRRTQSLVAGLDSTALEAVHSPLLSPLVWDLGHIAAFEDLWVSRTFATPMLAPELTRVYDADETPRAERGTLPFLRTAEAVDFMARVRERTLQRLADAAPTELQRQRIELIVRHELQHNETMAQTLQIAGLPCGLTTVAVEGYGEDGLELVRYAGGRAEVGSSRAAGFSYDNEQPRHHVDVAPFAIGRSVVSNGAWLAFIDAGGYQRPELWSEQGWQWRIDEAVERPLYWNRDGTQRTFAVTRAISSAEPVCHVAYFEAEAFARYHDARLPSELEWEMAATTPPADSEPLVGMIASVWQWTATEFTPYPGFRADPYPEYSEQFFGHGYRVLRGGAWVSSPRVATAQFRNWDHPQRRQIFSGLRLARDAEAA